MNSFENSEIILQDREDVAKYNLTVTAVNEDAIPKLMANCKVVVNVLDLNDNAPIFDKSIYFANVVENSPVNTSVIQVQARDQDDVSTSISNFPLTTFRLK